MHKFFINKARPGKGIISSCIFFILFTFCLNNVIAQKNCDRSTIVAAEKDYALGKFENTLTSLNRCLEQGGFTERQKEDAYRINAWTYLALDSTMLGRNAVVELLNLNPGYTLRTDDPRTFRNMVTDIRRGNFEMQVTSVSKKPENIRETPATVMVITDEDIRQRGYIDLEAMFSDLPGFDVSRTFGNTYSNIYQRGYRSNNTDRTLFLIDGVEENDLWANVAYLSRQYPITNVKRVEIVYGPASTMYGANAFLGVINVITKDPGDIVSNKTLGLVGEVSYGNYNTKYGDLTLAYQKNNVAFTATGRVFKSNEIDLSGYKEFDFNPADYDEVDYASILKVEGDDAGALFSSPYYEEFNDTTAILTTAGAEAARNFDKNILIDFPITYSNISDHYFLSSKLKIGHFTIACQYWKFNQSTGTYGNDNNRAGAEYGGIWSPSQTFLNTNYSRQISDKLSITNIAQARVNQVTDASRVVSLNNYSNGKLSGDSLVSNASPFWKTTYFYQISRQFRNELKLNYNPSRGLDIVTGVEIRSSSVQGNYRNLVFNRIDPDVDTVSVVEIGTSSLDNVGGGNNFSIFDYGIYLQGTYSIRDFAKLTLGGRYDNNRVRSTGGYGGNFSPRIAAVFTPGKAVLKLIFAQAFKDATNFQRYATAPDRLLNNPTLEPEKVTNYETNLGYNFNKNLFVDATLYYSKYSGAIAAKRVDIDSNTSTLRNEAVGSLQIFGLQATANYRLGNYSIYGNYTYVLPKVEALDENGEGTGTLIRIGDISSHRINTGVNALYFDRLNINLRANFASRRPVGEGTSVPDNTQGDFPSLFLLSGAITYKNLIPGLHVQMSVNNLLNKEYSDPGIRSADGNARPYRIPQRGISGVFKLVYEL